MTQVVELECKRVIVQDAISTLKNVNLCAVVSLEFTKQPQTYYN